MPSRHSPPLKLAHFNHPGSSPYLHRRNLYILFALLILYLWYTSHLSILPHHPPPHAPSLTYKNVDWTQYAYALYATDSAHLCNALMVFASLSQLGSRADRVLFYPSLWNLEVESSTDRDSQLLVKARDEFRVKLIPVDDATGIRWMAWSLTQYERVVLLESDVSLLKHLDGLFLAPRAGVAAVRAYWELPEKRELGTSFVLLTPSEIEYQQSMVASRQASGRKSEGDTEMFNRFYKDSAMVLSHREFGLRSDEFRAEDHSDYLGNKLEKWDPQRVLNDASLIFFSDEPLPKPWIMWPHKLIGDVMPKCKLGELGDDDCADKNIWMHLYDDFRKRRKDVCALLSAPAPDWPPRNSTKETN